ncbi:hypothetical protein [Flammeovirga sp. SubArs3]|uniref:hypothetical protein n=1 Tax=Flammeovirga sp. SubArs3 TaxID=2995316 RepID=UPI00248D1538|nr:hypothetical protein [Flammeovirga sp. SubArs3]
MKTSKLILLLVEFLYCVSFSAFADSSFNDDKKKSKNKDNDLIIIEPTKHPANFDYFNTPPEVKKAPYLINISTERSLGLLKDYRKQTRHLVVDTESDNILFPKLQKDIHFLRVYKDSHDQQPCMIIWEIRDYDEKGEIIWRKYTYKKYKTLGWRPVKNDTIKKIIF